jgi:hypothetical protein
MNVRFRMLWDDLSQDVKDKYHNGLAKGFITRDILNDGGVKFALLVLNDIHNSVSKKTCKYYMDLNNTFHPKVLPVKTNLHNCIVKLKDIAPNLPNDIDIEVLEELDRLN